MSSWSRDKAVAVAVAILTVASSYGGKWNPVSTNALVVVEHRDYTLGYWEEMRQAAWVVEELTPAKLERRHTRTVGFRVDPLIEAETAATTDYLNSGYDRGHLAPAADFTFDKTSMRESFMMGNISPQVPNLNRGGWATLEEWTRDAALRFCVSDNGARTQALVVVTGPIITGAVARIGRNRVAVPHGFFKAVYAQMPPRKMIGFVYWNRTDESNAVADHVVAVDEIERLTGLDLFSSLADKTEHSLESTSDCSCWIEAVRKLNDIPHSRGQDK